MTTHPTTRTEALAAGLKVYAWGSYCTKCQTKWSGFSAAPSAAKSAPGGVGW